MTLVGLVVVLLVIAVLYWCVVKILAAFGIGDPIRTVVMVVFALIAVLWLLSALFGGPIHVGRIVLW